MSTARLKKGIQARKNREPVEVDFTQHQLDDGAVVNTQERVVKDVGRSGLIVSLHFSLTIAWPSAMIMGVYRSKLLRCKPLRTPSSSQQQILQSRTLPFSKITSIVKAA